MTDFRQIDICPYFLNTDEMHTVRKKMWQGISQPRCSYVNFFLCTNKTKILLYIHYMALKRQKASRVSRTTLHCWGEWNKFYSFGTRVTQNPKSPDLLATPLHVS